MRFLLRKNRKPPTVIVVALIDVLMVVLIFMVVSKEPPHFFFGTSAVAAADLEVELKQRTDDNPELELSIRADTDAPWGQIVKLMDAAKAAGVMSVKAFTEQPTGE